MKDKNNQSRKEATKIRGSVNSSDVSSDSFLKGHHGGVEESSSTKSVTTNLELDDGGTNSSTSSEPKGREDNMDENINSSGNRNKPQSLTNNLNNMTLDARSGNPNKVNARNAHSQMQYQPEKWMLPDQSQDTLIQLNLAIVSKLLVFDLSLELGSSSWFMLSSL